MQVDVLTLSQLDAVFNFIHNLKSSVGFDFANVSRANPLFNRSSFEILGCIRSLQAYFSQLAFIRIFNFDFCVLDRTSNHILLVVFNEGDGAYTARLCGAINLKNVDAKANFHEVQHLLCDGIHATKN
jgi:hypothetical protein